MTVLHFTAGHVHSLTQTEILQQCMDVKLGTIKVPGGDTRQSGGIPKAQPASFLIFL